MLDSGTPVFGICLGNQMLGRALGLDTYKLRFGHRGVNQPVQHRATGRVHITQGTLDITANEATITLAGGDPSRAVFRGGPVTLKQELDDGSPMSARADNVDYNLKTEVVVFTGNVSINNPRGTLSGQRVVYNLKTGNVESGGEGGGKVKVRILPKSAQGGGA